jgi:hypothetical protein
MLFHIPLCRLITQMQNKLAKCYIFPINENKKAAEAAY